MKPSLSKSVSWMCDLGSPQQLRAQANVDSSSPVSIKTNAHVHVPPNFSAFESAEHAVRLAAQQSVRILGVSNYYDFSVYETFFKLAGKLGVFPLFGTEVIAQCEDLANAGTRINDPHNPGRMYLCGMGITRFNDPPNAAARLLATIGRTTHAEWERWSPSSTNCSVNMDWILVFPKRLSLMQSPAGMPAPDTRCACRSAT